MVNDSGEFEKFLQTGEVAPPVRVSEAVIGRVHGEMSPPWFAVFARLSLLHLVSGIFTLSICPQFGVRLFGSGLGVMGYLSSLGTYGCTVACGFVFLGTTALLAAVFLNPDQLRAIRKHEMLGLSALSLTSLGVFVMADAEILLVFAALWLMGAVLGGMAVLETGYRLRLWGALKSI